MASNQFPNSLAPKDDDIQKLLAVGAHLGTKNLEPAMERYTWNRRPDGVHIFDLQKTWEKIVLAARMIVAIEHASDICVISGRPFGQRAVLKFAQFTGAQALAGRYTPGTFTNQIQQKFMEPRLLILSDPRTDHQPLLESSYVNIPTIAFCNTDSPLLHVDVVIPCNNKGEHSIGLLWWLLCREVLYMKNSIPRGTAWDVMPDLFFYRDPTKEEKEEVDAGVAVAPEQQGENWGNQPDNWEQTGTSESWNTPATGESWDNAAVPTTGSGWDQDQ